MFALKSLYYKQLNKFLNKNLKLKEKAYQREYISRYSPENKIKVCTYQTAFGRHFTRFFTSTDGADHSFYLVDRPEQADVVAFINTIDDVVLKPDQKVILFFHEPRDYADRYQSVIHESRLPKTNLEVVSHLPSASIFINDADGIQFHRSIPYVHFHHMATYGQLSTIDESRRTKLICSIASGLQGIPCYQKRRQFFDIFSDSNSHFDLFGKFNDISSSIPAYRGQCISKWKTVARYKYSLVIENSTDDYYISEKIFDALICGSLPIYHGSDKIFEILPEEWFYFLPSLEPSEIASLNQFIATDAYKTVSEHRAEICKYVYKRYSFYSALERLLANQPLPILAK